MESGPTSGSTRGLPKARLLHPPAAIRAGIVKPILRFNQHVEAHQQAERILTPFIIDDGLVDDQRPAVRYGVVRLPDQHILHFDK